MRSHFIHTARELRGAVGEEPLRTTGKWIGALLALALAGCTTAAPAPARPSLDAIAERYVKLTLAVGEHDQNYVDAYYGPPEWRTAAKSEKAPLDRIATGVADLRAALVSIPRPGDELESLRKTYLDRQLAAMAARVEMLQGKRYSFDEESQALYDAVSPHHDAAHYQAVLDQIDRELPGPGTTAERVEAFSRRFIVPPDRLDVAMRAALDACRDRTRAHIDLPPGESFTVEYVRDKSWAGYNWYQGNFKSLIEVNVSSDLYASKIIDLACHEGYPGHHLYNALLEWRLGREKGWVEYTVYPLYSPQSLIAEGTGNYGIDVAFPGKERVKFEREVLFPLIGLDPADTERYYRIVELQRQLTYATNDAARNYLDGKWTAEQTIEWLNRYLLQSPDRARRQLRFIETYRSYVINYNLGRDLVRDFIEKRARGNDQVRWREFEELISSPRLPSSLR
jgi:hypothetical protein